MSLRNLQKYWFEILLLVVSVLTLLLQGSLHGFKPGHHGSVASHGLTLFRNSSAQNGFLGYTTEYILEDGTRDYDYFNRHPVFFAAIFGEVLSSAKLKLEDEIHLGFQLMNGIYLLTLWASWFFLSQVFGRNIPVLSAVILTFSTFQTLRYKDMPHFDQPAVLGCILILLSIALYLKKKNPKWIYGGVAFVFAMGIGYAAYSVLLIWLVVSVISSIRKKGDLPLRVPFSAMALAIIIGLVMMSYNISREARIRNVSWEETSVVWTAKKRFGLLKDFNQEVQKDAAWGVFLDQQLGRMGEMILPLSLHKIRGWQVPGLKWVFFVALFSFVSIQMLRLAGPRRGMALIAVFHGVFWCIMMRRLVFAHEYMATFYTGMSLIVGYLAFSKIPKRVQPLSLLLSMAFFIHSLDLIRREQNNWGLTVNAYTQEFQRIRNRLPAGEPYGSEGGTDGFLPGVSYALSYYLSGHAVDLRPNGRFQVTKNRNLPGINLTPENQWAFLIDTQMRETAPIPGGFH